MLRGAELPEDVVYCEMCGRAVDKRQVKTVFVEGALLRVCNDCYSKIMIRKGAKVSIEQSRGPAARRSDIVKPVLRQRRSSVSRAATVARRSRASRSYERYELVEDFAERVRRARERLGWSTRVLAMKVKESETTIKRIESGRLRPTIDLARRLEEVLGVKLLVPAIDEEIFSDSKGVKGAGVTLGEIVNIRED